MFNASPFSYKIIEKSWMTEKDLNLNTSDGVYFDVAEKGINGI